MVGGSPCGDVDGGRISLEAPTNDKSVVATRGIDLDVYDGRPHTRILGVEKDGTTPLLVCGERDAWRPYVLSVRYVRRS
jgi:hypothetical protein